MPAVGMLIKMAFRNIKYGIVIAPALTGFKFYLLIQQIINGLNAFNYLTL